ncbi:YbaK/EbsC family protein [Kingella negevensis]|uniref:YbaK/EbsC family protein n=1 Tax=Kingella negevensis TaxID=1522312 RepID=UPI002543FA2C|nr:YbaK/EbsC family protein [Kingella negevensis]WII93979.1 YbaK/EbsC family protein [Kingella negevensis]
MHEQYNVPLEMELNCIVMAGTRGETTKFAAIVLPYGKRANTGSPAKQALDAKKVSFAPLPEVIAATGMEFGSITPVGLPENWAVLIDSSVLQLENVMISGGLAKD